MALLWVRRGKLGINGSKHGGGPNVCKARTCPVDGKAVQTCVTKVSAVRGKKVTTIEGLAKGGTLHPVQQGWLDIDVPQCGFCQPGQIMAAVDSLSRTKNPTDADIDAIENKCRRGTCGRTHPAIGSAATAMRSPRGMAMLVPVAGGAAVAPPGARDGGADARCRARVVAALARRARCRYGEACRGA